MQKVKILAINSPVAINNGYDDIVGQTLPVSGNAYQGFKIHLTSGEVRHLTHYRAKFINRSLSNE